MGSVSCRHKEAVETPEMGGERPSENKMPLEYVEAVVCKEEDLKENIPQAFDLAGEGRVLVVRQKGNITAIGAKCTHYGAPLEKGVIGADARVRCPWHGACFNLNTGDIEDFPGLDSLPCHKVTIKDGNVLVKARKDELHSQKRRPYYSTWDKRNTKTVVIIGGGGAGAVCVETLRENKFTGRIVLITRELVPPYDRPKLSKAPDTDAAKILLRKPEFYKELDIEIMTETEAVGLDATKKLVNLKNGKNLAFDQVLIATGSRPRVLEVPGVKLKNVCLLRTPQDANYIAQTAAGKQVVIIGASFIGMEMAAYLKSKASTVTVVGRGSTPFVAVLGEKVGRRLQEWFCEQGVAFYMNCGISEFKGDVAGSLTEVVLSSGMSLPADLCILGVGVQPETDFLHNSGLEHGPMGHIRVNEFLETNIPGIYCGGDASLFPLGIAGGHYVAIGHWQMAQAHGRVVGLNMAGKQTKIKSIPFFWTVLFGKSVRYAGFGEVADDIVISGSLEELKFAAYYCKGENVCAIATMNTDPLAARFAEFLAEGKTLGKSQLGEWSVSPSSL